MPAITWGLGCPDPKPQKSLYIKPQPTIHLYNADELLNAIEVAEADKVYILKIRVRAMGIQ